MSLQKEVLPFVTTWTNLPDITLGEISPTEKEKMLYDLIYMWIL